MSDRKKSPIPAREQSSPEPERMTTPEEDEGMDIAELEDPPQAEGQREDVEERRRKA